MLKKGILTLASLVVAAVVFAALQTADQKSSAISWLSFEDARMKAEKKKKKMIIDVYTTWCGYCKKMDASTFNDVEVGEYVNNTYYPVKLNAESASKVTWQNSYISEREFASRLGVSGYPTTVVLDEQLKVIGVIPGYLPKDDFLKVAKYYGDNHYKNKTYEQYSQGQQ